MSQSGGMSTAQAIALYTINTYADRYSDSIAMCSLTEANHATARMTNVDIWLDVTIVLVDP